jgi:hypothetical protein
MIATPASGHRLLAVAGQIPIGKTGRIIEGRRYVGRFLRVEDDGHGNFIVITSTKRNFEHGESEDEVWDDWVMNENESSLDEYFAELGYVVEWPKDHDPNSVRPFDSVGTWTVEAKDAALARTPSFGQRFFTALFREFPALTERATFMAWTEQPEHVYAFLDYPECNFGVQVDPGLEYLIVWGPTGHGEYGDWNGDQVPPAMNYVRQIVAELGI